VITPAFTSRALPVALSLAVVLALAVPARWQLGATSLGRLTTALVAPVSHPFAALSRWIAPADESPFVSERVRELEARLEESERELQRVQHENKRLIDSLAELQVLAAVNTSPVRQVFAPIFASSSDLSMRVLRARAGTAQGVDTTSVATAAGLQLLGRVLSADAHTCEISPFNAKGADPINAIIVVDRSGSGLACRLTPTGTGSLKGPVEDRRESAGAAPVTPQIGQSVRLSDGRWPGAAQMLLIGRVVAVEPSPEGPLRQIVTVMPTIERLERIAEVVIRTNATSADTQGSPGGGA
jgi:hypothetical protein